MARTTQRKTKYWSGEVTRHSNALDLDPEVFTWSDPARIAGSLKYSAETSSRRKSAPLSLGDVDADLLHQPRRPQPAGEPASHAGAGKG